MLYFADTDWFLLSWRLLPLPTPHMVESARSWSAVVCTGVRVHVCVCLGYVRKACTCVSL